MDDMKTIKLSQSELEDLCREESNEYLELFESDGWIHSVIWFLNISKQADSI